MTSSRSTRFWSLGVGVALALGLATGAAQAREVIWSVGVASPGVQVGVSNAPQVVYQAPVLMQPQPVYLPQPRVYAQPQVVYYTPAPVVVAPQPVYYRGWAPHRHWHGGHWEHGHRGKGWRDDDHDRR